jgi:hypothetical protein
MTGELTLTGKVLAIGGVREKTHAARRVRVKELILPSDNRKDFEELPESPRGPHGPLRQLLRRCAGADLSASMITVAPASITAPVSAGQLISLSSIRARDSEAVGLRARFSLSWKTDSRATLAKGITRGHPKEWCEPPKKGLDLLGGDFTIELINGANNILDCYDITDERAIALWDRHLSQGKTVRGMGTPTPICLRPSATPGTASC